MASLKPKLPWSGTTIERANGPPRLQCDYKRTRLTACENTEHHEERSIVKSCVAGVLQIRERMSDTLHHMVAALASAVDLGCLGAERCPALATKGPALGSPFAAHVLGQHGAPSLPSNSSSLPLPFCLAEPRQLYPGVILESSLYNHSHNW